MTDLDGKEREEPIEKIQMYNLGGEYPELPTRLLAWPDFCTQVDRANRAEERVAELEAAAREPNDPTVDTERVTEFIEAADWLIRLLKDVIQRKVVRGLPEAEGGYYRTRSAVRDTERPDGVAKDAGNWEGVNGGDPWRLEVEVDCMTESEPFTVSVWVGDAAGQTKGDVEGAFLSSEQAREVAAVLVGAAEGVDRNNTRVEVQERVRDAEQGHER